MVRRSAIRFGFAIVVLVGGVRVAAAQSQTTTSPSADPVLAGYLRLYSGDRDGAYRHFETLRAREPENLAFWYGQLFAHESRIDLRPALQTSFEQGIDQLLAKADDRYSRTHADSEALFYLANGYLLRSRYRLDHNKGIWGAARDAAKSKSYSDEYLKQHPEHGDAYLALGLYNYYVDIAPTFIKVLRFILFLPAGSRTEGLKQLERAAREGSLFAPLADDVLSEVYGTFEGRVPDAVRVAERLQQRFPDNPDYRMDLARLYASSAIESFGRAADQYSAILARATSASPEDLRAKYRATLGLSDLRRSQWRLDEAIGLLTPVIDAKIATPDWVTPNFLLRRANYRTLLNDPGAPDDARRVLGDGKMSTFHKAAERQLAAIDDRRRSDEGVVYAELIPGNRLAVEHQWNDAKAAYDRVGASHPGDWQVKYRLAYLDFQRGSYDAAARGLESIVTSGAKIPRWLKAAAMLNLGWTYDIGGRRTEAVKLYKKVVDDYEDQGAAGAARLGLLTPYRPRSTTSS
ncbi:MAG: hypothetical protein AUF76_09370 [Acidobacteria bacterium 13_1_20CM_2_65_9]|nr:MAG: hypothetical protein AUF76_09370 [Acidobacteria bacterium 13_1_20CM_2_65_9]